MNAESMYQEVILDYYRHPHNFGTLKEPSVQADDSNVSCGDTITIQLLIEKDIIKDIKFTGKGCAISQAAVSLLTEQVMGKKVDLAFALTKKEVLDFLQVPISPMRLKCALLGLKVFKIAICKYKSKEFLEEDELK